MFKQEDIVISRIKYTAPEYQQVWNLREEELRKPLGMSLKNDDMSRDYVDTIFIAEYHSEVIGCVLFHQLDEKTAQLRQMVVYKEWQGKGIGSLLVQATEQFAAGTGYDKIILHARKVAVGFYARIGYSTTSDEFTEVGIPHFIMEKALK